MKPRRLTVTRTHPEQAPSRCPRPSLAPIPFLRLRGRWLEAAGFAIGKPVRVAIAQGLMVLEVIDHDERD